ncbi:MAG: type 1 glutamine amidotransferase [Galactobacter sp.]
MSAPTVMIVINSDQSGPRRLAGWLEEEGIETRLLRGADGLPGEVGDAAGLIMLGGGLMPNDDAAAPWLPAERALATQAIDLDLPTLGICLGGQLLAHVAGGRVMAKTGPVERGATQITPTSHGAADPVISALGAGSPMIENHEDMITQLPPDAVLLASSSEIDNQAFRLGSNVRGLQFHPEAAAENMANWDDAAMREDGLDLSELIRAAEQADPANTAAARAMVTAFAQSVRAFHDGAVPETASPASASGATA